MEKSEFHVLIKHYSLFGHVSTQFKGIFATWIHYFTPERKIQSQMWTGPGETLFFPWFCFNNEKLNSTGCKKFSNQRTDSILFIRIDIRWYSLRVVTYLR